MNSLTTSKIYRYTRSRKIDPIGVIAKDPAKLHYEYKEEPKPIQKKSNTKKSLAASRTYAIQKSINNVRNKVDHAEYQTSENKTKINEYNYPIEEVKITEIIQSQPRSRTIHHHMSQLESPHYSNDHIQNHAFVLKKKKWWIRNWMAVTIWVIAIIALTIILGSLFPKLSGLLANIWS